MSETRTILERGVAGFEPVPDAIDRTLRRVRRRRSKRRAGAATAALVVTAALVTGLWSAFRPASRPIPPVRPPEVGRIGGQRPLAVGFGFVWAISCVERCGNDERNAAGRLLRIDPSTARVTAAVPVGQAQAVAAGEGGVWVIDFWHGTVTRVDPATSRVVATIPLRLPFPVCRCPGAHDFVPFDLTTGAGAVWVVTDRGAVARIDPETNRVAAYIRIPGENGGGISVAGNRVWVATDLVHGVWAIDPATNDVVLKAHFVHGSHRVEAESLVASDGAPWAGGANVRRTGDPASPWALAPGGAVARIDPATGHLTATFDFDHPAFLAAAADHAVWVAAGTDRFYRIDTRTDDVSGPFSFGGMLWAVTDGAGWVVTADGGIERVPLP